MPAGGWPFSHFSTTRGEMKRSSLTFFKSADFAVFKRFQHPTRYSKTVSSVESLERKRRYSSSWLHVVRGSGTDARHKILLWRLWIQLETRNHNRFQIIGSQTKVACVNDANKGMVTDTDACWAYRLKTRSQQQISTIRIQSRSSLLLQATIRKVINTTNRRNPMGAGRSNVRPK
jgi:hypothetical protein